MRSIRRYYFAAFIPLLLAGLFFAISAAGKPHDTNKWMPPPDGVVVNANVATKIALAVLRPTLPDTASVPMQDSEWAKSWEAKQKGKFWVVSEKAAPDALGGGYVIIVSKTDGGIRGIYLQQ